MSFLERRIDVKITLGSGSFASSGTGSKTFSGLRITAKILKAGGLAMPQAQLQIFGLSLSDLNDASTLPGQTITMQKKNRMVVTAGDDQMGMATVFDGTVFTAWPNLNAQPQGCLDVIAFSGIFDAVAKSDSTSFNGSTDVNTILPQLASKMGVQYEGNGVSVKLNNPYLWGSPRDQAVQAIEAAGLRSSWTIDNGKLAVWPPGQARNGAAITVSPETGMKSYPSYTANGIMVETLFNPNIVIGSKINVQSSLKPASKSWVVFHLDHDLASQMPQGNWFTKIEAAAPGVVPLPPK